MTTLGPDGIEYPTIVIEGFNALHNRNYERFEELLENGLDINSRGPYYNSFIISPLTNYNITTVRFLLENGIDPNITDINNLTPLDYVYRLPSINILTDDELRRLNTIRFMLRDYGGYTSGELRTRSNILSRQNSNQNSSPNSIPSDPDYELMRNQAATQIQRRIRGRQTRQNRNYTHRNIGLHSLNPTMRERLRRFTDHNRMLQQDDPLSGYLHDVYFPPKLSSKSSSKTKSPSKSKRKVAKRTKKKRNRKNRY